MQQKYVNELSGCMPVSGYYYCYYFARSSPFEGWHVEVLLFKDTVYYWTEIKWLVFVYPLKEKLFPINQTASNQSTRADITDYNVLVLVLNRNLI